MAGPPFGASPLPPSRRNRNRRHRRKIRRDAQKREAGRRRGAGREPRPAPTAAGGFSVFRRRSRAAVSSRKRWAVGRKRLERLFGGPGLAFFWGGDSGGEFNERFPAPKECFFGLELGILGKKQLKWVLAWGKMSFQCWVLFGLRPV